jgi:hypothetical protein
LLEAPAQTNRILQLLGGGAISQAIDGGWVQRVSGLSRIQTYRLSGLFRSTWVLDTEHQSLIGYDPTGQDSDPKAATILWSAGPTQHGCWSNFLSPPIRPAQNAISIWLRARTSLAKDYPFRADFDNFSLQQIQTSPPKDL